MNRLHLQGLTAFASFLGALEIDCYVWVCSANCVENVSSTALMCCLSCLLGIGYFFLICSGTQERTHARLAWIGDCDEYRLLNGRSVAFKIILSSDGLSDRGREQYRLDSCASRKQSSTFLEHFTIRTMRSSRTGGSSVRSLRRNLFRDPPRSLHNQPVLNSVNPLLQLLQRLATLHIHLSL